MKKLTNFEFIRAIQKDIAKMQRNRIKKILRAKISEEEKIKKLSYMCNCGEE